MKKRYVKNSLFILLSLVVTHLSAMSPKPTENLSQSNQASSQTVNVLANKPLNDILHRYHWRLVEAKDIKGVALPAFADLHSESKPVTNQPIDLNFVEQRLVVTGTCNQQMAGFTIEPNSQKLSVGQIAQTMRACIDTELALKDDAIIALLTNLKETTIFQSSEDAVPVLTLRAQNGDTFIFHGVLTAEARFGTQGEIKFLEVAPQLVDCNAAGSSQCLQIREVVFDENWVRSTPNEEWTSYPNTIQGYTHEKGVRNLIRVKRFSAENLNPRPADLPDSVYVLDMVVEASLENQQ